MLDDLMPDWAIALGALVVLGVLVGLVVSEFKANRRSKGDQSRKP